MKPLLTLCMMVKDEAHTIARTLRSAKPWIDCWCILDTGSTDGTPDVVAAEMVDKPGHVLHEPFEDFATTRNKALAFACEPFRSEFILLLDADDILEGGDALRAFLEAERDRLDPNVGEGPASNDVMWTGSRAAEPEREAFYLQMAQGATRWDSARVVRGDAGWRYVGAVHEVLVKDGAPPPSIRISGVTIRHDPPPVSAERSRARWERDLVLLRAEVEKDPTNTRAAFYLAKTYKQLGRREEAIAAFERRVGMGGWSEERYDACFELARLLPRPADRINRYLEAHAIDPRRAEPLAAAAHLLMTGPHEPRFAPAFALAKRAWELPEPVGALFVDSGVYTWWAADLVAWSASYIGEWELGERAARQALANGPEHQRERLAANLALYEARKGAA